MTGCGGHSRGLRRLTPLVCLLGILLAAPSTAAAAAQCDSTWTRIASPSASDRSFLRGVDGTSGSDVWAAGYWVNDVGRYITLIEHWNGTGWSIVPSPNLGTPPNGQLASVYVQSPTNAWAVGYYTEIAGSGPFLPLVLHWNGVSWTTVSGLPESVLYDVAGSGPDDVWAVGYRLDADGSHNFAAHWNGLGWTVVPTPDGGSPPSGGLEGVTATSPTDAWAVGSYSVDEGESMRSATLALHWNGVEWSRVATPNVVVGGSEVDSRLEEIDAAGPGVAIAVGTHRPDDIHTQGLVERWNGTAWTIIPHAAAHEYTYLRGVSARTAGDAWMVGSGFTPPMTQYRAVIQRWDGSLWSTSSNNVGLGYVHPYDVVALPDGHVWTVGVDGPTGRYDTLTARYCAAPPPPAPPPAPPPPPPPPPPAPPTVRRCIVPAVRGKTLRAAKRTIASRRCRVGRVRRARSRRVKRGRVISQSRRAGTRVRVGSRVNLLVSTGRR